MFWRKRIRVDLEAPIDYDRDPTDEDLESCKDEYVWVCKSPSPKRFFVKREGKWVFLGTLVTNQGWK